MVTKPSYYKLHVGNLPDELFHSDIPAEKWLERATTADEKGFDNLAELAPIDQMVEIERMVGVALYMIGNVLPFSVPGLLVASFFSVYAQYVLGCLLTYVLVLTVLEKLYFEPYFREKYKKAGTQVTKGTMDGTPRENQYVYTERNISKYLSINFVWPASLHPPQQKSQSLVFCMGPHGVAPMGITAYPLWSKLWNDKFCHWTAAPAVMKLPLVSYFLKQMGYIPAKARNIHEALTKRESNVGIILDGINGMFQMVRSTEERLFVRKRKGIVKIALRAGASLVPVYGFGHTSLWTACVDPLGIMEGISNATGVSVVPFFGRYGWFLGPMRRIPVTVCMGDPIPCPQVDEPTKEMIDEYHKKLLDGYQKVFDTHKEAYGWGAKTIKFV